MGSHRRDELGIVGVILTLAIVFALVAVVELTRTLEAAQKINTTVLDITASVSGANSHLNTGCPSAAPCQTTALPVLAQTEDIAAQINTAAKPLSGQAGQVLDAVNSINTTASAILANASSINSTVHGINSSVNSINGSIQGVNSDVVAVKGTGGLGSGVSDIDHRADVIIDLVNGIKGDTGTITVQAGGILTQATLICHDRLTVLGLVPLSTIC
jgi:hypothetical protein